MPYADKWMFGEYADYINLGFMVFVGSLYLWMKYEERKGNKT